MFFGILEAFEICQIQFEMFYSLCFQASFNPNSDLLLFNTVVQFDPVLLP